MGKIVSDNLVSRVKLCLAETVEDGTIFAESTFPIEDFLTEAAIRVVKNAPLYMLNDANVKGLDGVVSFNKDNKLCSVELSKPITRLISFGLKEWNGRIITTPITEDSPLYAQQFHPATRQKVVMLTKGGSCLEVFLSGDYTTLEDGTLETSTIISEFKAIRVESADDCPDTLLEPIAWMTASLIYASQGEGDAAAMAMNKSLEMLQV